MIRWMYHVSMNDRWTSVELRRLVDWLKKCMKFRVQGRRPRRTWLESVEADMAKFEIDKEDGHDRNRWRRNVMKRESNPIGKHRL